MRQYRKFLAFMTLAVVTLISLSPVFAQPPEIGTSTQLAPFESSPTTHATDKAGNGAVANPANAYDTDWFATFATVPLTGNALFPVPDTSVRYFEVKTFNITGHGEFDPEWVDIKIRYSCPATTDDQYRIRYRVAPDATWYDLQGWVSGSAAAVTLGADTIAADWHDKAEPNDGAWDWTDVSNLVVRIETQMVAGNDAKQLSLYEVWATVYPTPKPPTASTAISIQPSVVMDARVGESFFIDLYVLGLTPPPGLQVYTINMEYDTSVVSAEEWFTYYPFISFVGGGIDDPAGQLSVSYLTFFGDTVGFLGTETAIIRIYFRGDSGGTCDLKITMGELKDIGATVGYYPPTYDGWVSVARVMSAKNPDGDPIEIDLTSPICTTWCEIHPDYCKKWHLASWEDNQPEGEPGYGELSECDQIDMTNETGWKYWFHVVEVTVTIHWEYKPTPSGEFGAAEAQGYPEYFIPPWDPSSPPVGTGLHEIYPTYCRGIYINDWTDTDDSGTLTASDQMQIMYMDDYSTYWVHVTGISTDIHVSQKPIPPEPPEMEFPLGVGIMMMLAPLIPLIYLLRRKRWNR